MSDLPAPPHSDEVVLQAEQPNRLHCIVGLGNPGGRYAKTPHNIGFAVVEELARRHGIRTVQNEGLAITGTQVSPDIAHTVYLAGREQALVRIAAALAKIPFESGPLESRATSA